MCSPIATHSRRAFVAPLRRHQRLDALTAGSCRERIVDAIEREAVPSRGSMSRTASSSTARRNSKARMNEVRPSARARTARTTSGSARRWRAARRSGRRCRSAGQRDRGLGGDDRADGLEGDVDADASSPRAGVRGRSSLVGSIARSAPSLRARARRSVRLRDGDQSHHRFASWVIKSPMVPADDGDGAARSCRPRSVARSSRRAARRHAVLDGDAGQGVDGLLGGPEVLGEAADHRDRRGTCTQGFLAVEAGAAGDVRVDGDGRSHLDGAGVRADSDDGPGISWPGTRGG